ncbi:sucrase ferredoxin [Actinomadura logoneensis]|uniref:Sucrase ferredoxin n=1 Tax=Actinomadura logoneensis TaxID=2293572 RepID=A0A372JFE9_9ACTN|nr:sucrase ferredoxin [Actinomadura logoneensis]RFU38727.1 sucrase ferredoxin [Actinomadura logoneensis]
MTRQTSCEHCPGSHSGERPCLASATTKARAWLLVEHPGPWPERIEHLEEPAAPARAIRAAQAAGVRPQLIRRSGRRRRATPPLRVYVGWSQGPDVWLETRELDDHAGLDSLDLAAVAAGRAPGWGEPVHEPVLLVCTHGRRNACCARTGAPLARSLTARFEDLVWETTHVGGDRYAANLVCLPHGVYYGNLGPAEAEDAAAAYLNGAVVLDRLRGRAGQPEAAQAAEHAVRALTGVLDVTGVTVERLSGASPYEAVVSAGGNRYRVVVERTEESGGCGPECQEKLQTHLVTDLTLLNEAALV